MNKYLFKKLEQAHGVTINQLGFIAAELCKERFSDVFECFFELKPKEIAKVLGWKEEEEIYQWIEEEIEGETFVQFLYNHDCTGFIAECYFPEHSNFRFKEDGRFSSCSVHSGINTVFWVYAESIGELIEKICLRSQELFNEQMEDFKKQKIENLEVKGETNP